MDEKKDAFETLLAGAHTAVERFVRAHIHNRSDAEDVLQETYLAAFHGFSGLRDPYSFLPWIVGIARKKCADWYRMQERKKEIITDQLPEMAAHAQDDFYVEETLASLPLRDQTMLRLFYEERLTQKEISCRLQIPEGTVKSRMNTARNRFRAAYPYPPRGEKNMKTFSKNTLPKTLPEYRIVWREEPAFPVDCEELMGWFIVPRPGEKLLWGMYDLPTRKLDVSYDTEVIGPASVHGLEGVAIRAKVIPPSASLDEKDLMKDAVSASTGGQEEWIFTAQIKDGFTRFLSAEHVENGVRTLTTFLDGDEFMDNWGFGEDNCGTPVHLEAQGWIKRTKEGIITAQNLPCIDIIGKCDVTLDGKVHETVCVLDMGMYEEGMVSEQYLGHDGRTVLWRRFNRDDWAADRYGAKWSDLLPENERMTINGQLYVHWYDCLCIR